MTPVLEFLGYFGGAAVVVGSLATWLGRVWADRILQSESAAHEKRLKQLESDLRHDVDSEIAKLQASLSIFQDKALKAHADKLACYGVAVDTVARLMTAVSLHAAGRPDAPSLTEELRVFEMSRIRAYGHMALVAPQAVMTSFDELVDYFLACQMGEEEFTWQKSRALSLTFINAARADIGVDASKISYLGNR